MSCRGGAIGSEDEFDVPGIPGLLVPEQFEARLKAVQGWFVGLS